MTGPGTDLVVERLVLDGVDLDPERARRLARLVEDELREVLAAGGLGGHGGSTLTDAAPVSLGDPVDLDALARTLVRRIVRQASLAGGDDV